MFAKPIPVVLAALAMMMISEVAAQPTAQEATKAMHSAVDFFRTQAAAKGGYVYQWSSDLARREGEGKVGSTTVWIQPPGTPAVGMAYLSAYQLTGDQVLLEAARETAGVLIDGQLESGGWDNKIELAAEQRKNYAYRTDSNRDRADRRRGKLRNVTTFDDNKSQSVIRFLMNLDRELKQGDAKLHESVLYALDGVLKSQYPCGAWPQRYSEFPDPDQFPLRQASIDTQWSRTFPGENYAGFYTLNDNTMSDLITTLLDAWEVYGDDRYLHAAQRGGEFFLRAQLPEPQPGWAQQYDREMHPAWARKFEPPAITGSESQALMRTLIVLYRRTAAGDDQAVRFLEPIPRALAYYQRSRLPDGRLARFYELGTNRPLFFTKDYQLTYSPEDMPTHYAFIVSSKLDRIAEELDRVRRSDTDKLWKPPALERPSASQRLADRTQEVIDRLDDRGAWVEAGRLRYHGDDDPTRRVIRSETFIENLRTLASWIAAQAR